MRYPPMLVQPMREELTRIGFEELLTPDAVQRVMQDTTGTLLVVVNSICGCAAAMARPGIALALERGPKPGRLVTVFAGMELDATDRMRRYFTGYEPSSPQIALFSDGQLVHMMQRSDIEGQSAESVADELGAAFAAHCAG